MRLFTALLLTLVFASGFATAAPAPDSFADLSARVSDAVVNISTSQKIERKVPPQIQAPEFPPGSPFQDFFEEFFNNPNMGPPGMGPIPNIQSLGSGFVVDAEKGYIVTNNHVIDDADEITVTLHDDTKLSAKIVGRDTETDLALLKVDTKAKLTAVSWGDSDTMRVGDWVLAVGNPFGLGGTVTSGIISARQRNINAGRYDDFIQTDASINRGNSGGPMFNLNGDVIGINTAIFSPTGGSVGIGFAIPSNLAKPVIDQLTQYGATKRGWIGVRIQEVTDDIAESLALPNTQGALIASLTPGGPAEKAGVKQGDIITAFNGKPVTEMRFLPRIVADAPIGKKASITILRQGKLVVLDIVPGQLETARESGLLDEQEMMQSEEPPVPSEVKIEKLKLSVAPLSDALRARYALDKDVTGVLVTHVERDGDAAAKGIAAGDVILEINQKTVSAPSDVKSAVDSVAKARKTSILLLVNSQSNLRFVAVKLAD
jgi:serine protease Do